MRYPELDIARGAAVIAMIAYHALFDITYFRTGQAPAFGVAVMIASAFILVSGICTHISWHRYKSVKKLFMRSGKLAVAASIITAMTFLLLSGGYIVFGIIHFFALAGLLAIPLLRLRNWQLWVVAIAIFCLATISNVDPNMLWLLPTHFKSFDYFPLAPWLGLYALGIYFGRKFYTNGRRTFAWKIRSAPLEWAGRNSLLIYFLHQPLIIVALYFLGFASPFGILNL